MPELAEVARTLTDTAVAHLVSLAPLFVAGAVALIGGVASCVVWLCYAELREGRFHGLAIEARVNSDRFVGNHRCAIVNFERIKEFQPRPSDDDVVRLRWGAQLPMGRGYREEFQEQVGRL